MARVGTRTADSDKRRTGMDDRKQALAPPSGAFGPVSQADRIPVLDVLRGFALLGIALMNIEFFTRPLQGIMLGMDPGLSGIDYAADWAIAAFVQGKFWTLFSLLFGMGFALMLERADGLRADPGFVRVYARRLVVLLLIGFAHATLLWAGDILLPYAVGGFVLLLLFRNTPVSSLWKWGLALYVVPVVLLWLSVGALAAAQLDPTTAAGVTKELAEGSRELREGHAAAEIVYRDGGYLQVVRQRLQDSLMQYGWMPMLVPAIVGMFLLGAWFIRSGVMRAPQAHAALFRRLLLLGGPLGTVLVVLAMQYIEGADMTVPTPALAIGTTWMTLGSLLLCLAYTSALVLLTHGPLPALRDWLGPVGRMALSNYLLQSLVFSTLFYGYGFGLWGQVARAPQVLLVLVVFVGQVLLSRWWLTRFRYGPVEWVWRALTYGTVPAMRV